MPKYYNPVVGFSVRSKCMTFKPKFGTAPSGTQKPLPQTDWKNRPFLTLKAKTGDEETLLVAFLSEREGKFGMYFSGKELILGDDGKSQKGPDGKTMKTDAVFFFDPKNKKLKMSLNGESTELAVLKDSSKFEGSFFGKSEDGATQYFLDAPKKK